MHIFLQKRALHKFKSTVNIKFFKDFVKRLVVPNKRCCSSFRSLIFIPLALCTPLFAAFEDVESSARSSAFAGAGVACSMGAESIFVNPAAMLCNNRAWDAILFYTKPFNVEELFLGTAALNFSGQRFAVAGAVQHFGNSLYRENQFFSGLAWRIVDGFVLGADARYALLAIQGYGAAGSLLFDAGAVVRLHSSVHWGAAIKNAAFANIGEERESLPQILTTGVCVRAASTVLFNADICKDSRFPYDWRVGIEYSPFNILSLRAGTGSSPARICLGFALNIGRVRLDYAFKSHNDLGATHLFAVRFSQ